MPIINPNVRYTPDGHVESPFREEVRNLLDLDWSARDETILNELRRLKQVEQRVRVLERTIALDILDPRES